MNSTILIIDDDDLLREILCSELHDNGYEVITASNGNSGYELAKRRLPDLILCDINMPDLDGYETLKLLHSNNITSTIPTILMTGVMREYNQVRQGMSIGADDYLIKPFTIPDLITAIQTRLLKQKTIEKKAESKLEELRHNITLSLPHELRTPLTALIGFSELLQSDYKIMEKEEIGSIAQLMLTASHRLHKIIEEYIDYSQIEVILKNPNTLSKFRNETIINVDELLESCANQLSYEFGRAQDLSMDVVTASIQISDYHFKKVITYLLENAFKFSNIGTPVIIKTFIIDNFYHCVITDKGCGMSEEQISNIDGYMQFDRNKHEQQGLGLGLITAKRIVEAYEGLFIIESQKNIGTTVTVKLKVK